VTGSIPVTAVIYQRCCATHEVSVTSAMLRHRIARYAAPDRGAEHQDDRVCVSVCLSASISLELHVRSLPYFCAS